MIRTFILTALAAAVCHAQPLTEETQRRYVAAVYDMLGIAPTPDTTERIRQRLAAAWSNQEQGEIDGTLFVVNKHRDIQSMPEPRRTSEHALLRISLIQTYRNNAAADPMVRHLLARYDEQNPALAPGNPPLTRESASAWIDLVTLATTGSFQISIEERERGIRAIAQRYSEANAELQMMVYSSIYFATRLKAEWPSMKPQARADWTNMLRSVFNPQPNVQAGQIQQMLNQHSFRMMQNQLNFMQQNTDTIMGSPPYFDPSCNCWKQRGGIVTEFR
ncbi:MAG: hypothetical protein JNL98_19445 [Bryobacterales bacterium]|nr:hypothetical protein [Bryobacterales bacterium]